MSSAANKASLASTTTSVAKADHQYIFTEEEFEQNDFQAAAFVAKYRRVSSLESLKDQLRNYSEELKRQLYSIINRDYKDFINIATKVISPLKKD